MKKFFAGLTLLLIIIFLVATWQLNWIGPMQSWQKSTGWEQIAKSDQVSFYLGSDKEPKISWLGHAGFIIEWEGQKLAFDPNLSEYCNITRRTFAAPIKAAELGKLDSVLISHAHYDHLDLPTLQGIPEITRIILPNGSQDFLSTDLIKKSEIIGLKSSEEITIGKLKIIAIPAVHNGSRFHPFKSKYFALGYLITNGEKTIYYSGDTAYSNTFLEIGKKYHPDIAILPIGAFRPEFVLRKYHLNPVQAVQAALDLQAKITIPSHFGTFRLSLDYPETALPLFAKAATKASLSWQIPRLHSYSNSNAVFKSMKTNDNGQEPQELE